MYLLELSDSTVATVEVSCKIIFVPSIFQTDQITDSFLVRSKVAAVILVGIVFHVAVLVTAVHVCHQRAVEVFGGVFHTALEHELTKLSDGGDLSGHHCFHSVQPVLVGQVLIELTHGIYEGESICGGDQQGEPFLKLVVSDDLHLDRFFLFIYALDFMCRLSDTDGAEVVSHKVTLAREFHD